MAIVDNIQKWATLVAAIIAAGASLWNLWSKFSENDDKIKVSFGSLGGSVAKIIFTTIYSGETN